MNHLYVAAGHVQELCRAEGWPYCFIGGLAVLRWGEPRLTRDVDVTIVAGFGAEDPVITSALDRFASRINDPIDFARHNRVLLLRDDNGIPIDIALGALPFEERAAQRATGFAFDPDLELTTCSAEDLIVMKSFSGRDRDWSDVAGIVTRRGSNLDLELIWFELHPLLQVKDDHNAAERLRAMLEDADRE